MAYADQAAKDKAIAVKEAEVVKLTEAKEKATKTLARVSRDLAVAQAEVEHRKTAPVIPPIDLLDGLEA